MYNYKLVKQKGRYATMVVCSTNHHSGWTMHEEGITDAFEVAEMWEKRAKEEDPRPFILTLSRPDYE